MEYISVPRRMRVPVAGNVRRWRSAAGARGPRGMDGKVACEHSLRGPNLCGPAIGTKPFGGWKPATSNTENGCPCGRSILDSMTYTPERRIVDLVRSHEPPRISAANW